MTDQPADAFPHEWSPPPGHDVQYLAHLHWRDWWHALRHRGEVRLDATQVDRLVPVKLSDGGVWDTGHNVTMAQGAGGGKVVAHGGPGRPGHQLPDGTWVGGGGAGADVTFTPGGDSTFTAAVGGPGGGQGGNGSPGDWPGQRACCASTVGGRHNLGCPEVAGNRARACCASEPGMTHTPSCPITGPMRDAIDARERQASPMPTHAHPYEQVCTEACPAFHMFRDLPQPAQLPPVPVLPQRTSTVITCAPGGATGSGGPRRGCCGTAPGTGHLASCDQQGD